MKVYVSGVDFTWDEARLRDELSRVGPVGEVSLPMDRERVGKNRGFAFVTFDDDTARRLLGTSLQVGRRTLSFRKAEDRRPGAHPPPAAPMARPAPPGPASKPSASSPAPLEPPYRFVPVVLAHAVSDAPVLHDGSAAGDAPSGEFRLTLEALTPLLVGCDQYERPLANGKKKKVLEPLRLPGGRVGIPGASIKGMLRHALGALLSAPMERVAERTWSYRPHLAPELHAPRVPRAAIVVTAADDRGEGLSVTLLAPVDRRTNKITFLRDREVPRAHTTVHRYVGGTDGRGELAEKFRAGSRVHTRVAVDDTLGRDAEPTPIDASLVLHYWRTLDHLADTTHGHLSERHPLLERAHASALAPAIASLRRETLQVGDLIYCEWDTRTRRVLSLGHNFRYRWRHVDSVRESGGGPRAILSPLPSERTQETAPLPSRLTAARGLMGYAGGNKRNARDNKGSAGIGHRPFEHLAGRVAINMAVECEGRPGEARFVGDAPAYEVPLKILGAPKPGAAEFYLRQDDLAGRKDLGAMRTYGDVAGVDVPGELAGRKFYLHQPDAAKDETCYRASDPAVVEGDQAMLARFVLRPGARFRFTIRFRSLRPWELGAVLLCLTPTPSSVREIADDVPEVARWLDGLEGDVRATGVRAMASKLGHGRPLGLGSVAMTLDACEVLDDAGALHDAKGALGGWLRALREKLDEGDRRAWAQEVLLPWLRVHRYAGRTRATYPTARNKHGEETIFGWHMEARKEHARRRQGQPARGGNFVMEPLDEEETR